METLLDHLSQSLSGNPALAYLGVFVGGILSSSSPCVLATIPLVIGYVGGYSEGDRRKALLYSLTFILGLSITFTILGAIASFIGGLFGVVGRTWYFIVGGVAVAIGLQLIGLYQWNLPVSVHFQPKQRGILGAFLLGLVFGIVSSHVPPNPRLDPHFCRLKRRNSFWNFLTVCLCNRSLCPDLCGWRRSGLCGRLR